MTPIFGKGVVFDASPERRKEMLHNSALRGEQMKGHAVTIEREVHRMIDDWGDDRRDRPARLLRRADHLHLDRVPDRHEVPRPARRRGSPSSTTSSSGAPTRCATSTRTCRSRASAAATRPGRLVALVQEIMADRVANPPPTRAIATCSTCWSRSRTRQAIQRFSADEITGMFISMMFAGHHTSSGTAAWTLIELLRHPDVYAEVMAELDELYADGRKSASMRCADPAAGERAQGDAAPAPAADHPDAAWPRESSRSRATRSTRATRGGVAGDLQPDPRGLPEPGRVRSRPLRRSRGRKT